MRTIFKPFLQFSVLIGLAAAGCGQQEPDSVSATTSAIENPIIACQAQFEACRGPAQECRAAMQACLTSVAKWVAESRRLLEQCRAQAAQCRLGQLAPASAMCETQFEMCIEPAFRPTGEDAGVSDEDAGVSTPPRRTPPRGSAAGAPAVPVAGSSAAGASATAGSSAAGASAAAGSSASAGASSSPFTLPFAARSGDACGTELLQCIAAGKNLEVCASSARECLRASFGPGLM